MAIEIKIYKADNDIFLELSGQLLLENCEPLKEQVKSHLEHGVNQIYIDLAQLSFIDSAGLGMLVGLKSMAAKNKARIILASPSRKVAEILSVSRLNYIFDIVNGVDAELIKASLAIPDHLIQEVAEKTEEPPVTDTPEQLPSPSVPEPAKPTRDSILDFCRQAVEFMRKGEYERAIESYQEALKLDPEYLPAHNNLAIVFEKKPSWYPRAMEQWQRVLEISEQLGDQKHIERARKHLDNLRKLF